MFGVGVADRQSRIIWSNLVNSRIKEKSKTGEVI